MSAQQSLDGVSKGENGFARAASAPSDRHGSGQPAPKSPQAHASTNAPTRGVQFSVNMFTALIPDSQLELGMRAIRLEYCRRCQRDTSHELRLIDLRPRTWIYSCPFCRRRRRQQG